MKRICQFLALALFSTFLLSCGGDDEKPGQSFHAVLDGVEFKEDELLAYEEDAEVEAIAMRGDDDYIYIWVDKDDIDGTGTYDIGENSNLGVDLEFGEEIYYMVDGEIKITKLSATRLEATFSGTAQNIDSEETIEITEGKIKVNIRKF